MAVEKAYPHTTRMCAEDLLGPSVPERFIELIEGELVEMPQPSSRHNRIAFNIETAFARLRQQNQGLQFGGRDDGYLIKRNPDTVLVPDACLYRYRPLTNASWRDFVPELWVEVLSPGNTNAEMAYKRQRLLDEGAEQFWLVVPEKHEVQVFHRDGRIATYGGGAAIAGEGIAEGLDLKVDDVFSE